MKKINICHFTVAHRPKDNRIYENECISLVNAGYDVTIVAPGQINEISNNIKIISFKSNFNPLFRIFYGAPMAYKIALNLNADIYHIHDIELFKYGIKLKKLGKKIIFDSHEDWEAYANDIKWIPIFIKKFITEKIKKNYKKYLNEFDGIITVSPHIQVKLEKYCKKVHLISNFPKITTTNLLEFSYLDYLTRENSLFYSGTVSNQEVILNAIQNINFIKYNIAGNFSKKIQSTLKKFSAWKKIIYFGFLSKTELEKIALKSTIAITLLHYHSNVSNNYGTLGNTKFFEYMKFGLPIICTDFILWKNNVIDKYNCGICVNPYDKVAVEKAIKYLLENKQEAYTMGQNGQKAFYNEFNWSTQEIVLLELYNSI
jgi:glycosyltransferase involved in cell wall biosynthesis